MLETVNSDYIRTAQAKGLTSRGVWIRHGLRNAIIPLTVFLGPLIFGLIGRVGHYRTYFHLARDRIVAF